MRVHENRLSLDELNPVASELVRDNVDVAPDDRIHIVEELLGKSLVRALNRGPMCSASCERTHLAGIRENGFAECLARDGPGVNARSPDIVFLLNHGHLSSNFGCLNGSALSGRPAPNTHEVEVKWFAHDAPSSSGIWVIVCMANQSLSSPLTHFVYGM